MVIRQMDSSWNADLETLPFPKIHSKIFTAAPQEVIEVKGVGIHTGKIYRLQITRGPANHEGILFCSMQSDTVFSAPARWTRLSGTTRSTALVLRGESKRKVELRTVEHFLAATFISGLSNLVVNIQLASGEDADILEMPILEGSSAQWWELLAPLRVEQIGDKKEKTLKAWMPQSPFELVDGSKIVRISPLQDSIHNPRSIYSCSVFFEPAWKQSLEYEIQWLSPQQGRDNFSKQIAPARTFGFMHELKALEARGLAKGGSLGNAIVLDGDKIVNPEGFKLPQELAAHKLLDAIGDFALLEHPILGRIDVIQAGHSMHLRALEEAVRIGALTEVTLSST